MTRLTDPGVMAGTPPYMAPEQLLGKPTSAQTDQFAFGVRALRNADRHDIRSAAARCQPPSPESCRTIPIARTSPMTCGRSSIARSRRSPKTDSARPGIWSRLCRASFPTSILHAPDALPTSLRFPSSLDVLPGKHSEHPRPPDAPRLVVHPPTDRRAVLLVHGLADLARPQVDRPLRGADVPGDPRHRDRRRQRAPAPVVHGTDLPGRARAAARQHQPPRPRRRYCILTDDDRHRPGDRGRAYRMGGAVRLVRARRRARVPGDRADHRARGLRRPNPKSRSEIRQI